MISVIHPSSSHFPAMGPVAGPRVPFAHPGPHPGMHTGFAVSTTSTGSNNPAMTNYGHQLMMAAKAGEQISDLYRRRDSGYTHHVSNSNYHHIPPTAAPQVPARVQQQQPLQRSSSSRSLSSYIGSSTASSIPGSSSSSLSKPKSKSSGRGLMPPPVGKDLSTPLFVDCSIEYELPNAPKIPKNSLPILMIHPGYKPKPQRVNVQPAKPKAVPAAAPASECNGHRGGACQCTTTNPTPTKSRAVKRSYATAMSNPDFYKHLNQPQPHPNQSAAHAYFDNTSSNTSTSALEAYAAAKRTRLQMAEKQLFNQQQQQLFQQQQQQQAQMQHALRHYQQNYYNRQQQQQTSVQQQQQQQMSKQQRDLRISSFQQITPPESLAFWQQQQQMTTQNMCRSACCTTTTSAVGVVPGTYCRAVNKYSPPSSVIAPACCYPMPPTPMVTNNTSANTFCLGCAQGKCQQAATAANAASSTKKVNMGIMRSL